MFRYVNKRLATSKELQTMKSEFGQCSLPIEFVHRVVTMCIDEIMDRGLNHPFILKNPCSPHVVSAMLTLMADPERRNLFSLKCMRIDTVAGVMVATLKNIREPIVPMEIQDELNAASMFQNSGASTPTTNGNANMAFNFSSLNMASAQQQRRSINTINALLNHPGFPAVNRALLLELLNLSLAVLNRSAFNHIKPEMLSMILGPLIFSTQHATILQHTPQQAYAFGWGVSLVNDIKRCSKTFYVVLGGYRREILGNDDCGWEFEPSATAGGIGHGYYENNNTSGYNSGASSHMGSRRGSFVSGTGMAGSNTSLNSLGLGMSQQFYGQDLSMMNLNNGSGEFSSSSSQQFQQQQFQQAFTRSRSGFMPKVSTAGSDAFRASVAMEAKKEWGSTPNMTNFGGSNQESKQSASFNRLLNGKGKGVTGSNGNLMHLRHIRDDLRGGGHGGQAVDYSSQSEDDEQSTKNRLKKRNKSIVGLGGVNKVRARFEMTNKETEREKEAKRREIEDEIRGCRGEGLSFSVREGEAVGA